MTREEEIKARLSAYDCKYQDPLTDEFEQWVDEDMDYLLARNEELQRRVTELEALGRSLCLTSRNHSDWPGCRIVDAEKLKTFQSGWVGSGNAANAEEK